MSAIETVELTKTFDDLVALDGLSLTVEAGELFGLLGPNGAGKTTAIKVLTGQLRPDGGRASVLGVDPATAPVETRRRVGILPEGEAPPSFLTPREYFGFVGSVRDLDDGAVADRVETWSDRLGFGGTLDTLAADLSRGQQQKVMIAAAFLHDPALVFIDEPLANLDPIVQERTKRALEAYVEAGNTVFLSTHHIEVAESICTRVGIVEDGRLIADRRPASMGPDESLLDVFFADVGAAHRARADDGG